VLGDYLTPVSGSLLNSLESVRPGDPAFFALWQADWRENAPQIHLLRVDILGLPSALKVDRVGAIKLDGTERGVSEVDTGVDGKATLLPYMIPVNRVTLHQVCLGGGNSRCPGWYVVGEIHATKPGVYRSSGVRVLYEVEGHEYYQDFAILIGISSTTEAPTLPRS
jgi:hypothetical protein